MQVDMDSIMAHLTPYSERYARQEVEGRISQAVSGIQLVQSEKQASQDPPYVL